MQTGIAPEEYALKQVSWQVFATYTFIKKELSVPRRIKLFFGTLRICCKWFHVYFPRLKWALRIEKGEKFGRVHLHCLIAGLPEFAVTFQTCQAIASIWSKRKRLGHADVRQWARGGNAVSYILKGDYSLVSANSYERAKFDGGRCVVILSESILKSVGDEGRTTPRYQPSTKG